MDEMYYNPQNPENLFEKYLMLPPENRMHIVDSMEVADRVRFTRCSKLSRAEARRSKNFMYGLTLINDEPDIMELRILYGKEEEEEEENKDNENEDEDDDEDEEDPEDERDVENAADLENGEGLANEENHEGEEDVENGAGVENAEDLENEQDLEGEEDLENERNEEEIYVEYENIYNEENGEEDVQNAEDLENEQDLEGEEDLENERNEEEMYVEYENIYNEENGEEDVQNEENLEYEDLEDEEIYEVVDVKEENIDNEKNEEDGKKRIARYGHGCVYRFVKEDNKKYMSYSDLFFEEIWRFELPDDTDLVQLAAIKFRDILKISQKVIKKLVVVLDLVGDQLQNFDYGVENLNNLEWIETKMESNIMDFVSKTQKPLKRMSVYEGTNNQRLVDSSFQFSRVQESLYLPGIEGNYLNFSKLPAPLIFMNIGELNEEDIHQFLKLWQNGKTGKKNESYTWIVQNSNFDMQKLVGLLKVEKDISRPRVKFYIKHGSEKRKALLYFDHMHLTFVTKKADFHKYS